MSIYLKLTSTLAAACTLVGCAAESHKAALSAGWPNPRRLQNVRTTAYSRGEDGGRRNAIGSNLAHGKCYSAASDWSRFPLGTRFRIVGANEEYIIDDYGSALIGTNTIDLYKPSRLDIRRWGVRQVDIDIIEWGSEAQSLKVLSPRAKHRSVQRMLVALQKKTSGKAPSHALD